MQKTRKSFSKRIRVTKNKKLIHRKTGQNHFNARNNGQQGRQKHLTRSIAHVDASVVRKNMPFA